jgi:hypothetical protein
MSIRVAAANAGGLSGPTPAKGNPRCRPPPAIPARKCAATCSAVVSGRKSDMPKSWPKNGIVDENQILDNLEV